MRSDILLYFCWGAPLEILQLQALNKIESKLLILTQDKKLTSDKINACLKNLEKEISYSHVALARLGEIYLTLGLPEQSAQTFLSATELTSLNTEYWIQWIYSHSLISHGKLPFKIRQKALELINKEPDQKVLVNLLAVDDYFQGNYKDAVRRWEFILETDQNLTQERRLVLQGAINSAQNAMQSSTNKDIALNINVSLSSKLQSRVLPDASVFVFIKSTEGSSIPLSVIRKKVCDLPFTVTLGDAQQMLSGQRLIPGQEIIVVAKISKSGDPLNTGGDLKGVSNKMVLNSEMNPILLEINETH